MSESYKEIRKKVFSKNFDKFWKENIEKDLSEIEKRRKYLISFLVITCIILIAFAIYSNTLFVFFQFYICLLIAVILYIVKKYKSQAKKVFMPKLISYIGNLQVITQYNQLRKYVKSLEIVHGYNIFSCDDCFLFNFNGVHFSISEIKLTYESDSDRKRRNTIFKGLLISFKSFKQFKHNVLIKQKAMGKAASYNKITLEDPEFGKLFDVYGFDQIEARYLITPAFMNRMVQLSKNFAHGLFASFENGMVNILIPSEKDWFDLPITKSATDIENCRAILIEFLSLFSIADTLKIDQNIKM